MKKVFLMGVCLVVLSAAAVSKQSGNCDGPPPYDGATTSFSAPPSPYTSLKQDFEIHCTKMFEDALIGAEGLGTLFDTYSKATLPMKKEMDKNLFPSALLSLQKDDARQTLTKLSPFFLEFLPRTTYGRGAIQGALKGLLEREIEKIQIPYHAIKHPSVEQLQKSEAALLPRCNVQHSEKAKTAISKERKKQLKTKAKEQLSLLKSQCNHAYIKQQIEQRKFDQLAAIYKHLPWSKRRSFKKVLRESRKTEERALKNRIKGLIRMAK